MSHRGEYRERGEMTQRIGPVRWFMVLSVALLAISGNSGHNKNVQPGDADYPQRKDHRSQFVQVTAIVPPTITPAVNVLSFAMSRADPSIPWSDHTRQHKPRLDCAYGPSWLFGGSELLMRFQVREAMPLEAHGDTYLGTFARDIFLPGRCEWQTTHVQFTAAQARAAGEVGLSDDVDSSTFNAPEVKLDVWCVRASTPNVPIYQYCDSLKHLRALWPQFVSEAFVDASPSDQRDNAYRAVGPATQSIVVRYHDIDAMAVGRPK